MSAAADSELNVTEIQRFCMHDGPGVRTTVFLKGCPLRCRWCHNPETQSAKRQLLFYEKKCLFCGGCLVCPEGVHSLGEKHTLDRSRCTACGKCADACPASALQISGVTMSVSRIVSEIKKDAAFYGERGGVTVSGGEPFAQPEGLKALLAACRAEGFNTAVDTCGAFDPRYLEKIVPLTDLFLWDIKDTDSVRLKEYTGADFAGILSNLRLADSLGARIRLRCILVKGVNDSEEHYREVARIAASLRGFDGADVLPYHAYSGAKAVFLGGEDNGRPEWVPDADEVAKMSEIINGQKQI